MEEKLYEALKQLYMEVNARNGGNTRLSYVLDALKEYEETPIGAARTDWTYEYLAKTSNEMHAVLGETYQLIGAYMDYLPNSEKWLDNISAGKLIHKDLLPIIT